MGWAVGYDENWKRDIGYGVPALCDHPDCRREIDRGLSYVCGGEPYGGEQGCGLFFCPDHLYYMEDCHQLCVKCGPEPGDPFPAKPDRPDWICWKLTDESWQQWRDANPEEVAKLRLALPQPEPTK